MQALSQLSYGPIIKILHAILGETYLVSLNTGLAIRWLVVDSLHPWSSPFGRLTPSKFDPIEFVSGKKVHWTFFLIRLAQLSYGPKKPVIGDW